MRRAFRIVAGVLGVAAIGLNLPFAITSFIDDAESIHRLHFLAGLFASGLLSETGKERGRIPVPATMVPSVLSKTNGSPLFMRRTSRGRPAPSASEN